MTFLTHHNPDYDVPTKKHYFDKKFEKACSLASSQAEKEGKSKFEILYNITSKKINNCQTRNAIFLKQLKDTKKEGIVYSSLETFDHIFPMAIGKWTESSNVDISCFDTYDNDFEFSLKAPISMDLDLESKPVTIVASDNAYSGTSFGIYFLTLKKFLYEKDPEIAKSLEAGSTNFLFTKDLPFSLLPILEISEEFEFKNKYNNTVTLILLSQDNTSVVPDINKSNYTIENFKIISDSCIGDILVYDLWNSLNFICDKFPNSKVLYVNKEYFDKGSYEKGHLLKQSPERWIKNPVDGNFVIQAEDLKTYISEHEKEIKSESRTKKDVEAKKKCLIF